MDDPEPTPQGEKPAAPAATTVPVQSSAPSVGTKHMGNLQKLVSGEINVRQFISATLDQHPMKRGWYIVIIIFLSTAVVGIYNWKGETIKELNGDKKHLELQLGQYKSVQSFTSLMFSNAPPDKRIDLMFGMMSNNLAELIVVKRLIGQVLVSDLVSTTDSELRKKLEATEKQLNVSLRRLQSLQPPVEAITSNSIIGARFGLNDSSALTFDFRWNHTPDSFLVVEGIKKIFSREFMEVTGHKLGTVSYSGSKAPDDGVLLLGKHRNGPAQQSLIPIFKQMHVAYDYQIEDSLNAGEVLIIVNLEDRSHP
jgi:hypothetical protein